MWDEIAEAMSINHTVIRLDFPGFGKSEDLENSKAMKLFARITNELLCTLNCSKFTLIGHSMGAYIGLELACICQSKINHFILLHSTAKEDSEAKKTARIRAIEAAKERKNVYLRAAIPLLVPKQFQNACQLPIKKMMHDSEALSSNGILQALIGMQKRETHTKTVQNLKCKVTYISGKFDPILSNDALKEEAYKNGADFIEIENAGHMSHWENPEELKAQLLKLV